MPRHVFRDCVICKGQKGNPRNGKRGRTCSAAECKKDYAQRRAQQPTVGLGADVPPDAGDKMPFGMWVHEIEEILGERCCELHKLSKKKRKNGPSANFYEQEFLVRGTFLEDDGDADDEEEDDNPEPNTFWVSKDTLLQTIDIEDVKQALRERHEAVLADL